MPFVKLDCAMLDSTLWIDRDAKDVFLAALLMAVPKKLTGPIQQIHVDNLEPTGFTIPTGEYGFIEASGPGIVRRACIDLTAGMEALRRLGNPEPESRSHEFGGRRLIRVDGGYVALNYAKYRERDYTNAERQRRFRLRNSRLPSDQDVTALQALHNGDVTPAEALPLVTVTQAEAEAEAYRETTPPTPLQDFTVTPSNTVTESSPSAAAPAVKDVKPKSPIPTHLIDDFRELLKDYPRHEKPDTAMAALLKQVRDPEKQRWAETLGFDRSEQGVLEVISRQIRLYSGYVQDKPEQFKGRDGRSVVPYLASWLNAGSNWVWFETGRHIVLDEDGNRAFMDFWGEQK